MVCLGLPEVFTVEPWVSASVKMIASPAFAGTGTRPSIQVKEVFLRFIHDSNIAIITPMEDWIFFASEQRLGAIRPDGTGEVYPDFGLPGQQQWRMGYVSADGRETDQPEDDSAEI